MTQTTHADSGDNFDRNLIAQATHVADRIYGNLRDIYKSLSMNVARLESIPFSKPWEVSAVSQMNKARAIINTFEDRHKPARLVDTLEHCGALGTLSANGEIEPGILNSLLIEGADGWSQSAKIAFVMSICQLDSYGGEELFEVAREKPETVEVAKAEIIAQLLIASELLDLRLTDSQREILLLVMEAQLEQVCLAFNRDLGAVEDFLYSIVAQQKQTGPVVGRLLKKITRDKETFFDPDVMAQAISYSFYDYLEHALSELLTDDGRIDDIELAGQIIQDAHVARVSLREALYLASVCKRITEGDSWHSPFDAMNRLICSDPSNVSVLIDTHFPNLNSKRSHLALESLSSSLGSSERKLIVPFSQLSTLVSPTTASLDEIGSSLARYIETGRRSDVLAFAVNQEHRERLVATIDIIDRFVEALGRRRVIVTGQPFPVVESSNICVFGEQIQGLLPIKIVTVARPANHEFAHRLFEAGKTTYAITQDHPAILLRAIEYATIHSTIPILTESEEISDNKFVGYRFNEIVHLLGAAEMFSANEFQDVCLTQYRLNNALVIQATSNDDGELDGIDVEQFDDSNTPELVS